ncbi:MAG: lasso peptide biosynthesis B2 protein [Pseudomonadota bacterium]
MKYAPILFQGDFPLLVQSAALTACFRVGLRVLSLKKIMRLLEEGEKFVPLGRRSFGLQQIISAVLRASHIVPGGKHCLTKALVAQTMLKRNGLESQLRIGVMRSKGDRLDAHAWVECCGRIVVGAEKDLNRYVPLLNWEGISF